MGLFLLDTNLIIRGENFIPTEAMLNVEKSQIYLPEYDEGRPITSKLRPNDSFHWVFFLLDINYKRPEVYPHCSTVERREASDLVQ